MLNNSRKIVPLTFAAVRQGMNLKTLPVEILFGRADHIFGLPLDIREVKTSNQDDWRPLSRLAHEQAGC
jgi:hypothetical protein